MNSKVLLVQEQSTRLIPSKKKKFTLVGKVVRNVLDKTATVEVVRKFRHSVYQKTVFRTKKYLVHDPDNKMNSGDQVLIANTRKISLRKSFFLVKILKKSTFISDGKEKPAKNTSSTFSDDSGMKKTL